MQGRFHALNGVKLDVAAGEVLGIVGESGCGKSSLALATIGLLPRPPARIIDGSEILFKGKNLLSMNEPEMELVRGTGIAMIFQEPLTSLNPIFTIGDQLCEAVRIAAERRNLDIDSSGKSAKEAFKEQGVSWLRKVGLPDPESALERYPHELSGGMRQRVMISMALAERPSLMLADEPTSFLDVTTQAQILRLTAALVRDAGASVMMISHDLAVVAQISDRVVVMYAGIVVEDAPIPEIYEKPLHPYTQALLSCLPKQGAGRRLEMIPGTPPSLRDTPHGCPYQPRCPYAKDACKSEVPEPKEVSPGHRVACVLY
jgi:peptide/nickel transport system ATP-binding protein/oligopeptide transport system ATP-binding protein